MKSIFDALAKANEQIANLRQTLVNARNALAEQAVRFPDLADTITPQVSDLDAKIAALDAPLEPAALAALAASVLAELKQVGTLHFTPTPHAGSGI
ncbi:MAG TPA: hypothetical protein PK308_09105 [Phycisphaerales bacterium]|nr:hypothetical protein [Phycisphaerales bacterium]